MKGFLQKRMWSVPGSSFSWIVVAVLVLMVGLLLVHFRLKAVPVGILLACGAIWLLRSQKCRGPICLASLVLLLLVALLLWWSALVFTLRQWKNIDPSTHPNLTRPEIESRLLFAKRKERAAFSDLYASGFYRRNNLAYADNYAGFTPSTTDSYVTYMVLGFMDIDAVFDEKGDARLLFPSFNY